MEPEFNYSSVASIVAAAEKSGLPISAIVLSSRRNRWSRQRNQYMNICGKITSHDRVH